MNKLMKMLVAASTAVFLPLLGTSAQAADWPSKNITLVVPYAAGGSTDILSRRVADLLGTELGVTVIVENRPGAGTTVATAQLARVSKRDADYRVLMASPGHTVGASLYPLAYDPVKDFRFIQNVIDIPNVLVVPAKSKFQSFEDFVQAAKAEAISFSSPGIGSSIHMSGELFKAKIGAPNMTHVPFRGSGEALPALLSGDVNFSFENLPTVYPMIKSGQLRVLAVTTSEASPFLPDVPTVKSAGAEQGLSDFATSAWFGLIGSTSMSDEAYEKLQVAVANVMQSQAFKDFLPQLGAVAGKESGEAFKSMVERDIKQWADLVEAAGLGE